MLARNTIQIRHKWRLVQQLQMLKISKLIRNFSTIEPHIRSFESIGLRTNSILFNPSIPQIYQNDIAKKQEEEFKIKSSQVSQNGAFCAYSHQRIKNMGENCRIVKDKQTSSLVDWNQFNKPMDQQTFKLAQQMTINYLNHKGNCIVVDGYAGWHPQHRYKVRTYCENSYEALFMRNMLIKPTEKQLIQDFSLGVDVNLYNASQLKPTSNIAGPKLEHVTAINLKEKKIAVIGSKSAESMKKSLFKIFQYYYPRKNILPINGSATIQQNGKVTVFCGLEDNQKSVLGLINKKRKLISADELAWGDQGVFNIQGGCFTKLLNKDHKVDQQIKNSVKYGTLVQNANFYPNTRNINFFDINQSPNAKASFPLNFMKNVLLPPIATHPKNVILFTCDAMGVLPPVAKLTPQQALYHFLTGYSCKIQQVDNYTLSSPKIKFQPCYGQENLTLNYFSYGKILYQKIKANNTNVWIVNTGWTKGKYGEGQRINSQDTQKIIQSIIQGKLDDIPTYKSRFFKLAVPYQIPGIDDNLLYPERGWPTRAEFDEAILKLSFKFNENYHKKLKEKEGDCAQIMKKGSPLLI